MPRVPAIKKLDLYGIVDVGASDPASGENGQLFYNTTAGALKIYVDGAWASVGSAVSDISGGLDNLLLTNGDNFLLTSGAGQDVLLLTSA